ncbi:ATPase [Thermoanaerobacter kivui]|uniref:ATPase n=1 Tax=Thermoanaerobacter kivui TaxID=2325 RepID=A0A097APX8_THEKI|nr:MoxR family ATPase [Thermoanaerobacter kivui]AIS51871.1 ATPase [Thermoanaerobacter kivui]
MKIEDLKGKLFEDNYINIAIEEYLKFKETNVYDEAYKRQILSELNNYLKDKRITSENIIEIVEYFQKKNPPRGSFVHWSNLDDLYKYAKERPVEVAELLNYLYEESVEVGDRIERFLNTAKSYNLSIKLGTSLFGYLLAGFNMRKYPLFKDSIFKDFLDSFGIKEIFGDIPTKYSAYYNLCLILLDYFKEKDYIKNPDMMDVQDFIFCMSPKDGYKDLYVKVSVRYLYEHAKILDSFNRDDKVFIDYINKLDRDYIGEMYDRYRDTEKVNEIRFEVCKKVINDGSISIEDLEEIKSKVSSKHKKDILKSWNNFKILFPFYYEKYKKKINIELRKIYDSVKSIETFRGYDFKENEYICDFYGPQNFGGTRSWFAIYSKDKDTHKDSAQLFFSLENKEISYGLYIGSNLRKIDEVIKDDIDSVNDVEEFTYNKMEKKFVEVFDRFKEINESTQVKADNGDNVAKDDGENISEDVISLGVDFNKEIKIRKLFFEDADILAKRISTALKSGKHIILVGPPGTGKSKLAKEICESYEVDYEMVTAMSDWSTYDTIGGYRPEVDGTLYFDEGIFLRLFKDKKNNAPTNKWLIIDEINRADIDKAFGSLFSALTGDKVTLSFKSKSGNNIVLRPQQDNEKIEPNDYEYIIPKDFRIIGTINTYDKTSLYEMSYAFMRRFAFIPVGVPQNIDKDLIERYLNIWGIEDRVINNVDLKEGLAEVWSIINKYRKIGPAIIKDIAKYVSEEGDYTSAIILYVLPQFEGLMVNEIKKFAEELYGCSIKDFINIEQRKRLDSFIEDFFGV